MRVIEIRWIDKNLNERIFTTPVYSASSNFHAIITAVYKLTSRHKGDYLEIKNIECVSVGVDAI